MTVTYDTLGVAGNAFTLAASGTSNGTVSGATLTGGANSHTFTSGAVSLPSMAAEIQNPEVPSYGMNFGIRGNTLKVALARSGQLNATLGLIAQGETIASTSAAGTPTELVMQRFSQFLGQVKRNGVQLGSVVSGRLHPLQRPGQGGGDPPGRPDRGRRPRHRRLHRRDRHPLQGHGAARPGHLQLALRDLVRLVDRRHQEPAGHRAHHVYLPKAKRPVSGPKGIQTTFNYQAAKDPTTGHTFTIVLTNDVAGY
jgi:hypothetical protein